MKKIIILFEDDWELLGNGLGNVADLQYLPSLFLLEVAERFGIKINFMVEVLQQLAFARHSEKDRNVKIQKDIWDENVRMLLEKGHDVQLHLHPQWHNANYQDGYFRVSNNWNIGTYTEAEQESMVTSSIKYLSDLLAPIDSSYSPVAFKAGSWALQPSKNILTTLSNSGIRIVMGVGKYIHFTTTDGFEVNYTGLEEDMLPYYPDYSDIQKISDKKEKIIVLPLPYYTLGCKGFYAQVKRKIFCPRQRNKFFYHNNVPSEISNLSRTIELNKTRLRKIKTILKSIYNFQHFDLSASSFDVLKLAFDQIIARALKAEAGVIPIVLQSHTKHYSGNYDNVCHFLEYLTKHYKNNMTFMTFTDFVQYIDTIGNERVINDCWPIKQHQIR